MPPVSLRVAQTETAVIDDLLERYCDVEGLINLAPGAPAVLPSIEVRRAAATAGLGPTASAYGDVLGFEPLRTRWMQTITASWDALWLEREARAGATTKADAYGLELMVTAGANQGFVSLVLALSDPGDEVVLLAPYYFSHYNALTVCGVTPVVVRCDEATLLPTGIDDVRRAFSARTKAVVLVSPGNPSGVVAPSPFVDSLVALCRASDVWLLSDEAYWEITYDGAECSTPRALQGVVKIYTMSKVYGMAGWRVGALLYPKELSVHLRKVQDTIPTHATMVSQVAAYHALADDSALLQERLQNFSSSRRCFVKHLTSVYSQVELPFVCGDGAFYFFLPVASGAEPADGIVDFLVRTSSVLVVPGSAFGLANYVRVSYGSVLPEDAEEAAQRLRTGLEAWFARNGSRGGAST